MSRRRNLGGATALYRLWGHDVLLYVGISHNPESRLADHRRSQPWACLIDDYEWQWRDTRIQALVDESNAIRTERPLFNIEGSDGSYAPWFWMLRDGPPTLNWRERLTDFAYVCQREPRILALLERVRRGGGSCGECYWDGLRYEAEQLVGWKATCEDSDVRSTHAYEVVMTTLWEALPWAVCSEHQFTQEDDPYGFDLEPVVFD